MLRAAVSRAVQLLSTTPGPQPIRNIEPNFTKLFINNEWTNSSRNTTIGTFNPANGRLIAEVEEADWRDVDKAVKAANDALQPGSPWRCIDGAQRGKLLHTLADLMERDKTILASLESLDNGKPFKTAYEFDLTFSIDCLRHYADLAAETHGSVKSERKPVAVCGHVIPFTAPLIVQTWTLAPTLAAGDTVVIKLPPQTPLSGLHVASLIKEANFPAGVVNVVVGYAATAGRALCSHKGIRKFEATTTGTLCRPTKRRPSLEPTQRSPNIVFADANLDDAIRQTHYGMFFKDGHCYSAGTRTFVQGKIYDEFVDCSREHAERRIIGDPFEPSTEQGPQVRDESHSKKDSLAKTFSVTVKEKGLPILSFNFDLLQIDGYQVRKILRHVERGKREGAQLITGELL
ncbi:hypothetical protein Y032_0219g2484 [Ancylostoma ceylanicum]|uniref:Aldehyde dehydrogenase domain-containing protein n=1 Tax=Ancylostoma ceylanicum TaxID=53326 RepID=A0A016SJT2_9BILA|nr:hypothetical protein Y032_0219g2484 [Ancylostoma ceylanicum]